MNHEQWQDVDKILVDCLFISGSLTANTEVHAGWFDFDDRSVKVTCRIKIHQHEWCDTASETFVARFAEHVR